ncbi:MAG TPA: hypothetical protein VH186_20360 [Chloroflexia bacterium]|nr:hypothetical protein [Chloroflexia bacterium]
MQILEYFLQRPATELDQSEINAFEKLFADYVLPARGKEIPYDLALPKWQFLCYLCDQKHLLLHGSNSPDIAEFEPRKANDIEEFGNRLAVYASSDGIWPMYFAIVNRDKVTLLVNACFKTVFEDATSGNSYYYFSVDEAALASYAWQEGTVYIIRRETFEQQPEQERWGMRFSIAQWASPVAVKPLAKLAVTPEDFPFLSQTRGHDPVELSRRAAANPAGFPWHE